LKILLDEMYPLVLADLLAAEEVEATTVQAERLAGEPDEPVLSAAVALEAVVLTENVADFARLAAERIARGSSHPGVLIALSSRFSRRRAHLGVLAAAVVGMRDEDLRGRVVYLERPGRH